MGANVLDTFIVALRLDPADFKKGAADIDKESQRLRDNAKKTFGDFEKRGNDAAAVFKTLRNEVVGLGLAFMGAKSITGLVTGMLQGAAAADRIGRAVGIATGSVYAWRKAVTGVGGQPGEADAALQSIANAQTGYIKGTYQPGIEWARLGITGADMRGGLNPSQMLEKIGGMRDKLSPKLYDSLLQEIGLPASVRYLLEDPKTDIKALIKRLEKDTAGQEKMASEAEKMQKSLTDLNDTLTKKLVGPITTIANILNSMFGAHTAGGVVAAASDGVGRALEPILPGGRIIDALSSKPDSVQRRVIDDATERFFRSMGVDSEAARGIAAGVHAEGGSLGFAPGTADDHGRMAFGIGQWRGPRQRELFRRFGPHPDLAQQLWFLWHEMTVGKQDRQDVLHSHNSYDALMKYVNGFMRPNTGAAGDIARGLGYLRSHPAGPVTNVYNIRSTDPKAAAHEIQQIHRRQRRHAVAQADRGVAP